MTLFPYPTPYPLEISGLLECLFHAGLCILAHGVTDSAINIHRESAGVVAQLLLHGLDGAAGLKGKDCAAMPLRYNYDKPEKPRISRAFGYLARFFILFQTEKSSREVVIS